MQPHIERVIGAPGYRILGVLFFAGLGWLLYRASQKPTPGTG